jgi:drug/metabolite transporter (DMT)-like permease
VSAPPEAPAREVRPEHPARTYAALTLAAVFWGGTFVAGRELGHEVAPVTAAWLRFTLATLLLWAWLLYRHRAVPSLGTRQWAGVTLLGLSGVFAYNLFFFEGLKSVEAGRAALIVATNPVIIALASRVLFDEPLGWRRAAGIVVSVCGAIVVIARGDPAAALAQGIGHGEWLLLGCVASWTVYTLVGRRVLHGLSPLVTVAHASLVGTLLLAAASAVFGVTGLDAISITGWLDILYLAVFGTVLAFVWYYAGVHAIGAARAAQFINLVPVSGVLAGALLLDEPLTGSLLGGGALVLAGLWLTNRGRARRQAAPG